MVDLGHRPSPRPGPQTVRDHLSGKREPGVRRRREPDALHRFVPYLQARFADGPHVWATGLHDEVVELGYTLSYPSFVRSCAPPRCAPTASPATAWGPRHHRD
ncbi:MAG: hypothetical protein LC721_01025 [Actinobacteria bacterium]|nr:hypothetical protein [Actinomycetota bacterium]